VLEVEVVLASHSETPIDFVEIRLEGRELLRFSHDANNHLLHAAVARHGARTLGVGEHRLGARFELPPGLPPSYQGAAASVVYTLEVHVSIPWWPDRRERFMVAMAAAPEPFAPTPRTIVSTLEGPRGTTPFLEAALESTTVEAGGDLAGAVSVANTRSARIRGVDLYLVCTERARAGTGVVEQRRVRWRILDTPPEEGKPIHFRVRLRPGIGVDMRKCHLFEATWHLEVVVDQFWGLDTKLRVPIHIVGAPAATVSGPRGARAREAEPGRWVAPVGRERRALTWATIANRYGLTNDAEHERMVATIRGLTLAIELTLRGREGLYVVATMRWPNLGIDLSAERRSLADTLVRDVHIGEGAAAKRLTVLAREDAQGRAVFDDEAVAAVAWFTEVHVDDDGATLASPGGAATVTQLDTFVQAALTAARALAFGIERMPAPAKMARAAAAWEAFAQRLGGRLDRGAMRIREGRVATETVELETLWTRRGEVEGTALRVALSPPLDTFEPSSPALSAQARELATAIVGEAKGTRFGPEALEALVPGPLEDPETVAPLLQRLVQLARAARGAPDGGPYR
jgi:hypothetical protein